MYVIDFGSKIVLLDNDSGISDALKSGRGHERKARKIFSGIIKDGSTIVDIGANIGVYALLEAKSNPNGIVHAIEPVKENIEVLKQSIELNGYTNIKTYELAIGDENKNSVIQKAKYSNSGTLLEMEKASEWYQGWFGDIHTSDSPVVVQTLDYFVESNSIGKVDVLRMDVEGYEVNIFRGAQKTLASMPSGSIIALEIHPVIFPNPREVVRDMMLNLFDHGFYMVCALNKAEEFIDFEEETLIDNGLLYGDSHCPQIFLAKK